jgi:protein phosphatase inhibitor 2
MTSSSAPRKKAIVWDEDNLQHNEANRTAKMKIDEPKTPFNHNYTADDDDVSDDDDDHDDKGRSAAVTAASVKTTKSKKRDASGSSAGAGVDLAALEQKMLSVAEEKTKLGDDVWHPNEQVKSKNAFADARKKHYNEFQKVRELAARQKSNDSKDDADDDDDDDDDQ